jgi:hypothetical protein
MNLTLPPALIEWTNEAWTELLKVGGLGAVKFRVVEQLPFGADAHAMTWRGEVLIRREWIQPVLNDLGPNNELSLRHLWAVSTLAWHEPVHVLEQRGIAWPFYLLRYVWQWIRGGFRYRQIAEEVHAYEHQAKLAQRWRNAPPVVIDGWSWTRPAG